jgi:hypothetical protein
MGIAIPYSSPIPVFRNTTDPCANVRLPNTRGQFPTQFRAGLLLPLAICKFMRAYYCMV